MYDDSEGALQIQAANPKVKKSKSHARYEGYKRAKTVAEFYKLGGSRADLNNDVARGYIKYTASANYVPTEKKKSLSTSSNKRKERRSDVTFSPPGKKKNTPEKETTTTTTTTTTTKKKKVSIADDIGSDKGKKKVSVSSSVTEDSKDEGETSSTKKRRAMEVGRALAKKKKSEVEQEIKPKKSEEKKKKTITKKAVKPAAPAAWNDDDVSEDEDICAVCRKPTVDDDGEPMPDVLICEACEAEVHLHCSGLKVVPKGAWYCSKCSLPNKVTHKSRALASNEDIISIQGPARCLSCGNPGTKEAAVFFCNVADCTGAYHLSCFAQLQKFQMSFASNATEQESSISEQLNSENAGWSACPKCTTESLPITLQLKEDAIDPADQARLHQLLTGLAPQLDDVIAKACLETTQSSEPVEDKLPNIEKNTIRESNDTSFLSKEEEALNEKADTTPNEAPAVPVQEEEQVLETAHEVVPQDNDDTDDAPVNDPMVEDEPLPSSVEETHAKQGRPFDDIIGFTKEPVVENPSADHEDEGEAVPPTAHPEEKHTIAASNKTKETIVEEKSSPVIQKPTPAVYNSVAPITPYYIDLGWWHKHDPISGKFFYVHERTGATQWATPHGISENHARYPLNSKTL